MRHAFSFLSVQSECLQDGRVMHGEENNLFRRGPVRMLVPAPERHDERVAFFPVKRLAVDHRGAAAAKGMIDAGARMTVSARALSRAQHLNAARERGES